MSKFQTMLGYEHKIYEDCPISIHDSIQIHTEMLVVNNDQLDA
jgi:hypothetical protein